MSPGSDDSRPDWKSVSRVSLAAWLVFYILFLVYAARDDSGFLAIDNVNLVFHEAGHPLFSYFGYTLMILGGTLGELLVPFLIAVYFYRQDPRETAGVAFCGFWFFENFLYIGTYMADARTLALPLVGSGDHDWEILFTQWGLLIHDRDIGGATRTLGWIGMIAAMLWLAWMARRVARYPAGDAPGRGVTRE